MLIIKIILKMKMDFKCEIKTTSRWQQVTVYKWVIATERNHLTVDSFRNEAPSSCSETQNSAVAVGNHFLSAKCSKNRQYGV